MNDQDLEAKIYDLLATDKSLIEIVDNIMGYVKQDRKLYGIECQIKENKFWRYGLFNQDLSAPPFVDLGSFQRRNEELQTKKDNLIKEARC